MNKAGPKPAEYHPEYSKLPETAARAKQIGEPFFFTGKRCLRGHLAPRYSSSSNCSECIIEKRAIAGRNMRAGQKIRSDAQAALAMEALQNGIKTYVGRQCPKGHNVRRATTGNCIECERQSNLRRKENSKWKRISDLYSLTKDQVEQMLVVQNNSCAICSVSFEKIIMHIDHCHNSNKVRSLLCSKCNQAIGLLDENIERFEKAAAYLKAYSNAS